LPGGAAGVARGGRDAGGVPRGRGRAPAAGRDGGADLSRHCERSEAISIRSAISCRPIGMMERKGYFEA
jgi:hypothetical protein